MCEARRSARHRRCRQQGRLPSIPERVAEPVLPDALDQESLGPWQFVACLMPGGSLLFHLHGVRQAEFLENLPKLVRKAVCQLGRDRDGKVYSNLQI